MACGLALLASGQAFAANYVSGGTPIINGDLTNANKWTAAGTCGTAVGAPGAIAMTNADTVVICKGHSLNLSTAVTFDAGTLVFDAGNGVPPLGTWAGTGLKFSAGDKHIITTNGSLPAIALNISSMVTAESIFIDTGPVAFSSVTGGTLDCGSGVYTPNTPIASGWACTVTVTGGSGGAVSAPIFSTKEKPAVFSEEVK